MESTERVGAVVVGGDQGEEVLVFEKVLGSGGYDAIEGVDEVGVELAEGKFVDIVGEVECCNFLAHSYPMKLTRP